MPWLRFLVVLTCFLICSVRAQAAPAPIVFDFEDGLQGWTPNEVFRQEVDLLGGDFAIFGLDFSSMSISINLTDVRAMTFDTFFTGDSPELGRHFVFVHVKPEDPFSFGKTLGTGESLATEDDPNPNPDRREFDLSPFTGFHKVSIAWNALLCIPENPGPCSGITFPGFIDNITFHPVPEPSSWLLLSLGIAGMVMIRRKVAARARS